jgi:hypothetical protein
MPSFQLDGSWVDVATIALALLFVLFTLLEDEFARERSPRCLGRPHGPDTGCAK